MYTWSSLFIIVFQKIIVFQPHYLTCSHNTSILPVEQKINIKKHEIKLKVWKEDTAKEGKISKLGLRGTEEGSPSSGLTYVKDTYKYFMSTKIAIVSLDLINVFK